MDNTNQNLLTKNYDESAISSILGNTKIAAKPILAWKFISGEKVTVEVSFYIIRKARNEIVVRAASRQSIEHLSELAASANNLNFYLPKDMVLFQTEVKQIESNGDIRVTIPTMIAQVDRRKGFRLFVENGIQVGLSFSAERFAQKTSKQHFKKGCFDISSTGLSFIVSKPERKFFDVGDTLNCLEIQVDDQTLKLDSEIVSMQEVAPTPGNKLHYKGWKIALRYLNISDEQAKVIDDFVFRYLDFEKAV